MLQRNCLWITLFTVAFTQTAMADPSVAICPAAGTTVTTSTGDVHVYLGPTADDPELCRQTHNGRPLELLFNLEMPMSSDTRRTMLRGLFPLQTGKKAEGEVIVPGSGSRLVVQNMVEVLREEQITTPAGTFDTWVIQFSPGARDGDHVRRVVHLVWFDKTTGATVRTQALPNETTSHRPADWEAVRVTRP